MRDIAPARHEIKSLVTDQASSAYLLMIEMIKINYFLYVLADKEDRKKGAKTSTLPKTISVTNNNTRRIG